MNPNFEIQFQNPDSSHRGYPFWAWNTKLDKEEILAQVEYFKEMGLGGFVIHSRTGLDTPYLENEFMDIVAATVEKARQLDMKAVLYDEDRWPSDAAGGLVTKDMEFRQRQIVFTPLTFEARHAKHFPGSKMNLNFTLLARYEIALKDGYLTGYRMLNESETGGNVWYAYCEIQAESAWFNNRTYVDTLNKKAIEKFVETTHEAYFKKVGQEFGKTIPSIFTDEPCFAKKTFLGSDPNHDFVILPYTDDFPETFEEKFGTPFFRHLPEVIWELPNDERSIFRYQFHEHITERFVEAFSDTIGNWCDAHNIKMTGHMMAEESLQSQTEYVGEAMRSYRSFGEPGIDILCSRKEYSTAKQAQSAANQFGQDGVMSELYGVTNWDFDFRGHKNQGDWQAALGITTRIHHLSWMTMQGDAKRDYPASIFYQSPWYQKYDLIENHFARVNLALKSGKPVVKVGVIHPIESYWIYFGPMAQTSHMRKRLQKEFDDTINFLLFGLIDFDFISEALLPDLNDIQNSDTFRVGEMNYDAIIVPGCVTLRRSTLERLEEFSKAGGQVIFMGEIPKLVDVKKSEAVLELAQKCAIVPFNKADLLENLNGVRMVDITLTNGTRADSYLHQIRKTDDGLWLFIANGNCEVVTDAPEKSKLQIKVKGRFAPTLYDTLTGKKSACACTYIGGFTEFTRELYDHDSLLVWLENSTEPSATIEVSTPENPEFYADFKEMVDVTLSEPNVLILDQAEYSLDGGPWQGRDELLKIDDALRRTLGLPSKLERIAQPWVLSDKGFASHTVTLKFGFVSEIALEGVVLAIEKPHEAKIQLDGVEVSNVSTGWYVDKLIKTVPLPQLTAGEHELLITMPFAKKTCLEWLYILGDFGVQVNGSLAKITAPVRQLAFGDWVTQGLPFYGGNVTYHCPITFARETYLFEATKFRAPLLEVALDDQTPVPLAFSPYRLDLGELEGLHTLHITAFGSRINTFGAIHNCNKHEGYFGPFAWRSQGVHYSYEYNLKECGILKSPRIFKV